MFFKKVKCVECGFLVNKREVLKVIERMESLLQNEIIWRTVRITSNKNKEDQPVPCVGFEPLKIKEIKEKEKYCCLIMLIKTKRDIGLDGLIKNLSHLLMSRENIEKPRKCEFFFSWLPGVSPEMHLINYLQEKVKRKSFSRSKMISVLEAFRWLVSIVSS